MDNSPHAFFRLALDLLCCNLVVITGDLIPIGYVTIHHALKGGAFLETETAENPLQLFYQ